MIRVIIADDHPIVRTGLKQIIADAPDMTVTDEANDGHETLRKIREKEFDVVILDITMPGMGGLDVLKQIRIEKPKMPVVVLSYHPEEQYAIRVLRAGASGYLTKGSSTDQVLDAIRKVYRGGKYITPSLAERLAGELEEGVEKPPHEGLSDREFQVLCLIASGKRVRKIAEELSLSTKTISTYRSRILEKMKMKSNAELTHYAIKNRLVD
ncbi:MAG: response regulator transcription factor [Deltaproteobacteria bacterium]|nr:response regulator transcription factor [Deltaproteobacteria bacterium]